MGLLFFIMYIVLLLFLNFSCSMIFQSDEEVKEFSLEGYTPYAQEDYEEHLKTIEKFYLKNSSVKFIKLSSSSQTYLDRIIQKIISKNELFFKQEKLNKVYVVQDSQPFHFSFPDRHLFFSSGLIAKYIKHEGILASIIAYELVRSEKLIFNRKIKIPTGFISTPSVVNLLRVSLKNKIEVHKWAFHSIKKAGFDFDQYLAWIQIQNRNNLDFSFHLGDYSSISREETLFKRFLIKESTIQSARKSKSNSSKNFYRFTKEIARNS